ncbi:MAG: hypothetical protein FD179_554 [Erysipelotrichaceae bacterium]|nr:MAG: hypothetical protein FD179_554 [Erysipelotrichaceae bacterium]
MNKLRKAVSLNMMSEEKTLQQLRRNLGFKKPKNTEGLFWIRNGLISFTLICLVLFGSFYDGLNKKDPLAGLTTTLVSININPSFTLEVNTDNKVLKIIAENDDAEGIKTDDLEGLDAVLVVETLILRAQEAGYLTDSDYVVVATAPAKVGDEDDADDLYELILENLEKEGVSDDVNVALIKATLQQLMAAKDKDIPLGLFVVNGLVNNDGVIMSVSDFLKSTGNLELLETISSVVKKTTLNTRSLLERFLDRLERAGVDVESLRTRAATEGENLAVLKAEVLALWDSLDEDTQDETSLTDDEKVAISEVIAELLAQLKALGIDVSSYEAYLATDGADLQSIEEELDELLDGLEDDDDNDIDDNDDDDIDDDDDNDIDDDDDDIDDNDDDIDDNDDDIDDNDDDIDVDEEDDIDVDEEDEEDVE